MSESQRPSVTQLLAAIQEGDRAAHGRLLPLVYDELRRIAQFRMRGLPAGQTLQPTALVHEAYLKLVPRGDDSDGSWENRAHFFGAAASAMRNILVDRARRRNAGKRGGGANPTPLDGVDVVEIDAPHTDLLALDEALTQLEAADPRAHQIVMLRFFAGLGEEQVAELLNESTRTLRREWTYARAWLHRAMSGRA